MIWRTGSLALVVLTKLFFRGYCFVFIALASFTAQPYSQNSTFEILGIYDGVYYCNQLPMGLQLTLVKPKKKQIKAIFTFYEHGETATNALGSFKLHGILNASGDYKLRPRGWIKKPKGYQVTGIEGVFDGGETLTGNILIRQCSTFSVNLNAKLTHEYSEQDYLQQIKKVKISKPTSPIASTAPPLSPLPNCSALLRWSQKLFTEYPQVNFRKEQMQNLEPLAVNLFADADFVPVFGLNFDVMPKHQRAGVSQRVRHCGKQSGFNTGFFPVLLSRPFQLEHGNFSYHYVVSQLLERRNIRQQLNELLADMSKAEGEASEKKNENAVQLSEGVSLLWPSEQQAILAKIAKEKVGSSQTESSVIAPSTPTNKSATSSKQNDDDELLIVTKTGTVIKTRRLPGMGTNLGSNAAKLANCKFSGHYRQLYLEQLKRLDASSIQLGALRFDQGFAQGKKFTMVCDPKLVNNIEQGLNTIIKFLQHASLVSRSELLARKQLTLSAEFLKNHDPALVEKIQGQPNELPHFGKALNALEFGTIWHQKYFYKYFETGGATFWKTLKQFRQRRVTDFNDSIVPLKALIEKAKTADEIESILARYMGARGDKQIKKAFKVYAFSRSKLNSLEQQGAYEIAKQPYQSFADTGKFGELEIMQSFVNSTVKSLRFYKKLSEHSVLYQYPIFPDFPFMVTVVTNVEVQQCHRLAQHKYQCRYNLTIKSSYSKYYKELLANSKKKLHPLMKLNEALFAEINSQFEDDVFELGSTGWYSPSMVLKYKQTIAQMSEEFDKANEQNKKDTELFSDWFNN